MLAVLSLVLALKLFSRMNVLDSKFHRVHFRVFLHTQWSLSNTLIRIKYNLQHYHIEFCTSYHHSIHLTFLKATLY